MEPTFVLHDLSSALRAGWQVYDKRRDGYLMRRKNGRGLWELAVLVLSS